MEIKTKYNIGEQVFILYKYNIYPATIEKIKIIINKVVGIEIGYNILAHDEYINFYPNNDFYSEDEVFSSPEEIINNIEIKVQK